MMRDLQVGCVLSCGNDNRLKGMITDRDIVIGCCAQGRHPADVQAREFAGEVHWVAADADVSEIPDTMERQQIHRLPVIDIQGGHHLVGIISEVNIARNLSDAQIAEFAERVYAP